MDFNADSVKKKFQKWGKKYHKEYSHMRKLSLHSESLPQALHFELLNLF